MPNSTRRKFLLGTMGLPGISLMKKESKRSSGSSAMTDAELMEKVLSSIPKNLQPFMAKPETLMGPMTADQWQADLLRSRCDRIMLNITRQGGKSQTASALAIKEALFHPVVYGKPALILMVSPTLRQSGELFREKFKRLYKDLGCPVPIKSESALTMELANGSRIVGLPGEAGNILGYSAVTLLVIDEAGMVPDPLYYSVRPMIAVSKGSIIALSTPWGKRGWFYDEFTGPRRWSRYQIPAQECPRISPDFLAEERDALGDRWYRQSYECCFEDMMDAVISSEDVADAMKNNVKPLWSA